MYHRGQTKEAVVVRLFYAHAPVKEEAATKKHERKRVVTVARGRACFLGEEDQKLGHVWHLLDRDCAELQKPVVLKDSRAKIEREGLLNQQDQELCDHLHNVRATE